MTLDPTRTEISRVSTVTKTALQVQRGDRISRKPGEPGLEVLSVELLAKSKQLIFRLEDGSAFRFGENESIEVHRATRG